MTIKEAEEKTGLSRSNIRYYEKEKLISPMRRENNGYREYSEKDINDIKKIAYLRTLDISIEEIRKIMAGELSLHQVIARQAKTLDCRIADLEKARAMCKKMLSQNHVSYEELDVEQYVTNLTEHWKKNERIFQVDSVGFLYLWGRTAIWGLITAASLLLALLVYAKLPKEIPVQWSHGAVSSLADKRFIFAYPAACVIIRFLLRPFIWRWLQIHTGFRDMVSDYIANYICFAAFSAEVFTILYIEGIAKHITTVFLVDTAVLIGLLLWGCHKLSPKH